MKNYRSLRRELPQSFFKPDSKRLFMMLALWLCAIASITLVVGAGFPWYTDLLLALVVGHCWGVSGLIAHELMHGAIVKKRVTQNILSFIAFLPFIISPTFWRYWHNNLHHSHTQRPIIDPDAFPHMKLFKQSKYAKWMYPFTPGSGSKRSSIYLFTWFFVTTQRNQFYLRFRNNTYEGINHKKVNFELALAISIHVIFLAVVGYQNWVWLYVIPFLIQNYIPFSYISTNHTLSPLTKVNDPLENSLTVTNHPIIEFLHINFGYHVEHHLFPTMSHSHHKKLHKILKEKFPDNYNFMPKSRALKLLYSTPRIYKNNKTLIHPINGSTAGTLGHPLDENISESILTQKPLGTFAETPTSS